MLRATLLPALVLALTSPAVQAWGGFHTGFTQVSADGIYHWAPTDGSYSGSGYGGYGANPGYNRGGGYWGQYGNRSYGGNPYGGYQSLGRYYGGQYGPGYYHRW